MPKALLTNREWWYPDSEYADPPHWEERLFGNRHRFCTWYHNRIRYGLLEWGPLGWLLVLWHRGRERGRRQGSRFVLPRCADCKGIMWGHKVGYEGPVDSRTRCLKCYRLAKQRWGAVNSERIGTISVLRTEE